MLLYHDPRAPNPRRVRVFLAEKAVAYDTIEVLIANAAHQTAEFRKKNPIALLPVLELSSGQVLRESMAICRYIEETHPDPNLMGADTWERAQVEQWNRHAELELLWPIAQVFRNSHKYWEGKIKQAPEFAVIMREHIAERFDWFESELAKRSYLAGDRFTVADITALCAIDFGKVVDVRIAPATHPSLAAWHKRVSERQSSKA
ncbi:MAG: glutathione S-transferase family protein [Deltaproteobacteria bacterium]|nr:glutathione S-transferase family protein [Deltaproteobacteria bacterium]